MHNLRRRVDHRLQPRHRHGEHVHAVRAREVLACGLLCLRRVRGREVLGGMGRNRLHGLRRREVLGCARPHRRKHVRPLPRGLAFAQRRACGDELRLQRGLHGTQRRGVRRVRGGDVQERPGRGRVRQLRRGDVRGELRALELRGVRRGDVRRRHGRVRGERLRALRGGELRRGPGRGRVQRLQRRDVRGERRALELRGVRRGDVRGGRSCALCQLQRRHVLGGVGFRV